MVLVFGAIALLILGIVLYITLSNQQREVGVLGKNLTFVDNGEKDVPVLRAQSLALVGKPDAIVKENDTWIPVEIKTGKTPSSPYTNHSMQLMAYCLLVEETYHRRPPGGYLRYPQKEFKLAYTKEAEASVRTLVAEILKAKKEGKEFSCTHPDHN